MAKRVDKSQFQEEVLQSVIPVLVEFYSDSCIPCKQLSPILGQIEEDYEEKLKVVKVNVNYDEELAETYHVMAAPTILFFQNGEEIKRLRGAGKKEEVVKLVQEICG